MLKRSSIEFKLISELTAKDAKDYWIYLKYFKSQQREKIFDFLNLCLLFSYLIIKLK